MIICRELSLHYPTRKPDCRVDALFGKLLQCTVLCRIDLLQSSRLLGLSSCFRFREDALLLRFSITTSLVKDLANFVSRSGKS